MPAELPFAITETEGTGSLVTLLRTVPEMATFCAKQAIIYRKKAFAERLQSALCVNVVSMLSLCGCRLAQAATQSNSLIRSVSYVVGIHRLQSY